VKFGWAVDERAAWRTHAVLGTFTNPKACGAAQGGKIIVGYDATRFHRTGDVAEERADGDSGRTEQHKEISMKPTTAASDTSVLSFDALNWVASDCMPRDQEQSHRLHEPAHMNNSIDPITGRDIENLASHPHIDDGILTVYFESDETRQAYLDTPVDHPFGKLPGKPSEKDDRGG
jgi:hypothetical protein